MAALATTAPAGSVIVPVIVPRSLCANASTVSPQRVPVTLSIDIGSPREKLLKITNGSADKCDRAGLVLIQNSPGILSCFRVVRNGASDWAARNLGFILVLVIVCGRAHRRGGASKPA